MILHYLKMALRSLIRYKVQNIISITGIAVGFVCFAFSMIWIKYEMSYDSFHRASFVEKASVTFGLFVILLLIVLILSMLTLYYQINKAAHINPAEVMKSE